jgi:hypothetical protein
MDKTTSISPSSGTPANDERSVPAAAAFRAAATARDPALPYLIIGAGPAGLAAGRALSLRNIAFEIVERHSGVGGIWDIANPGSPMYESAHFISSKTLSGFPGYPMPDEYPDYPNHRQLLEYIRGYATHCNLYPHIRFNTAVERVEPAADGAWLARFAGASSAGAGARRYAGVIVATGGIAPTAAGAKITLKGGDYTVVDGPFVEAKELVGGWALMECRDLAEAVEWSKRFLGVLGELCGESP